MSETARDSSGNTDPQTTKWPDTKSTPEAAAVAAIVTRGFAEPLRQCGLAAKTDSVERFAFATVTLPLLPGQHARNTLLGAPPPAPLAGTELMDYREERQFAAIASWTVQLLTLRFLSGLHDTRLPLSTERHEKAVGRLARIFNSGLTIDNLIPRMKYGNAKGMVESARIFSPLACVQAAAFAHGYDAEALPTEGAEVNAWLVDMCNKIRSGEEILVDATTPASAVQTNAMRVLADIYHLSNSVEFASHALAWLSPLYLSDKDIGVLSQKQQEVPNAGEVFEELSGAGITLAMAKLRISQGMVEKAQDSRFRRRNDYAKQVDAIYLKLRMLYVAKRIVNGIARGSLIYTDLAEAATRVQDYPLGRRNEAVELAAQEESRRLADLGYLSAELDLDPSNAISVRVFPGDQRPHGESRDEGLVNSALDAFRHIEPYRLRVIAHLKAMSPGSRVLFKLVGRGQAQDFGGEAKVDIRNTERYIILVFPDGSFIAEYPEPEHATIMYRPKAGSPPDPNAFERILEVNIATAVAEHGAIRIEHPRKEDMARDLEHHNPTRRFATIGRFTDFLLDQLTLALQPGEGFPNPGRLRRMGRVATG